MAAVVSVKVSSREAARLPSDARLTSSPVEVSLREHDLTPPTDDPLFRHHVLHVLLPSLGDGRDTSACAEHSVTIA